MLFEARFELSRGFPDICCLYHTIPSGMPVGFNGTLTTAAVPGMIGLCGTLMQVKET